MRACEKSSFYAQERVGLRVRVHTRLLCHLCDYHQYRPHLSKSIFLKPVLFPHCCRKHFLCSGPWQLLIFTWKYDSKGAILSCKLIKSFSLSILDTNLIIFMIWWWKGVGRETTLKFPDFTQGHLALMVRTNQLRNSMWSRWVVRSLTDRLPWSQHKQVWSRIDFLTQLVSSQSTTT